jgi:hypothetical protein
MQESRRHVKAVLLFGAVLIRTRTASALSVQPSASESRVRFFAALSIFPLKAEC